MPGRYSIYAHIEEPVYQHLERVAKLTNQAKGYIIAEGIKRVSEENIPVKYRKPVQTQDQKRGWFEPLEIFSDR